MLNTYALSATKVPQNNWKSMSDIERLKIVKEQIELKKEYKNISIKKAEEDGQVIIIINEKISAGERGVFLLDFEKYLKDTIEQGINVWCEPIGDKNSLRNLRGIQIKS